MNKKGAIALALLTGFLGNVAMEIVVDLPVLAQKKDEVEEVNPLETIEPDPLLRSD